MKRIYVLILISACFQAADAQSVHQSLKKGDRQYDLDNYKAAEKEYRTAADLKYDNPKTLYNLGNALYQQGEWEKAAERFDQAARYSTSSADVANALHNLGSSYLKLRKYKEAVTAYENSLRFRPGDEGCKMNLQMAKKKLREEEQQNKEKQQKQQQQQQESQNNQQQDPNQGQQAQDKQPQQQPQEKPQQKPQGAPQQPEQQQPEQNEQGKLKKEDAKRLLETAVGPDDQRNARKYRSAQQPNKPKGSRKDW